MYTLEDIDKVRRKYYLGENNEIKLQFVAMGRGDVKSPDELTAEEKSNITAVLFLKSLIRKSKNYVSTDSKTEEEIITEAQTSFLKEALLTKSKQFGFDKMYRPSVSLLVWEQLAHGDQSAKEFFMRILAENGKVLENYSHSIDNKTDERNISYDLKDKSKNPFVESLNPNNPIYTQNSTPKVELSVEDRAKRRAYVEKAIKYYNMMEKEEWYQERVEKENKNMQRVANIVNNNGQIATVPNGPGLFRLLKAAQNLSMDGQTDYFEEILAYPAVHQALLEFKKSEYSQKMKTVALRNEQEGKIDSNGMLVGHSLTQGEKELHSANVCIRHNPNVVSEVRQALSTQSHITFGTTTDDTRLSNLYCLVARTQGKIPSKDRTLNAIEFDSNTNDERET